MLERTATQVADDIRHLVEDSEVATWPDEAMVAALDAAAANNARASIVAPRADVVPGELLDEYARARLVEHFPPVEPRILARARAVRLARRFGF